MTLRLVRARPLETGASSTLPNLRFAEWEAFRAHVVEPSCPVKDALWRTYNDKEHRLQHWFLALNITNAATASDGRVATLEGELADLKRKLNQRGSSPHCGKRQRQSQSLQDGPFHKQRS